MIWADNISRELSVADPANEAAYTENAEHYIQELTILEREILRATSAFSHDQRRLVTDHDALAYFASAYDFDIVGSILPTLSDQAEPSPRHIAELTESLKEENLRVIALGEDAGKGLRDLADALAEEAGVQVVSILTGSLASPGSPGDSYLSLMRYNVEVIVDALSQ